MRLVPDSLASQAYGSREAGEQFACNFGLNPAYRTQIFKGNFKATGFGPDGEVRLLEFSALPFFIATLFVPQVQSTAERPHPLIRAFLHAAAQA